jgi:hypothetical protein
MTLNATIAAALETAWKGGARSVAEAMAMVVASGAATRAQVERYYDDGICEVLALGR